MRFALRHPSGLGLVALSVPAALACGVLAERGYWLAGLLAIGAAALVLVAIARPEQVMLGFLAVLPAMPYAASVGGFSVFLGLPVAITASVILLLRLAGQAERRRPRLPIVAFIALSAAAAVSAGLSVDPTRATTRVLYLASFGLFAWALGRALAAGLLTPRRVARAIVYGGGLTAVGISIQVLLQFVIGASAVEQWMLGLFPTFAGVHAAAIVSPQALNWYVSSLGLLRGVFPFMTPPSSGQYMMLSLVAAVWLRRDHGPETTLRGLLETLAVIFIAVALLLTFSRQSWVGAILGVIALGVRRRPGMMVGVVLATVVALVFVSVPNSHQSFGSYLVSAGDTNTASSGTRLSLYQQALQLIPQTPLQGVGPGLYSTLSPNANVTVYYAHNFVLDSIIEIGFAGCVAMLTVFALSLREGILRAGRLGFGMLAAFLVANMFDDVVYFPRNGFLLAAAFALAAGSALTSERLAVRRGTAGAAPPPATSGVPGRRPVTVGEPL